MIETTKEVCRMCGAEYEDSHVIPRAPFSPYWCEKCKEEAQKACADSGGLMATIYQVSRNPWEDPLPTQEIINPDISEKPVSKTGGKTTGA